MLPYLYHSAVVNGIAQIRQGHMKLVHSTKRDLKTGRKVIWVANFTIRHSVIKLGIDAFLSKTKKNSESLNFLIFSYKNYSKHLLTFHDANYDY